jgi:hypothetical protein
MLRAPGRLAVCVLAGLVAAPAAHAQGPSAAAHETTSVLRTQHRLLRESLERINKGSASWREAVSQVGRTGRHVLVVTPDQVTLADRPTGTSRDHFDLSVLAEASPVVASGSRVDVVVVVVNLALLEGIHAGMGSLPAEFHADLDRVLVHEIFGHALPYLLVGDTSGRCADPGTRERAADACSIRRENVVRAELGLGRRVDYGLGGLGLSRGRMH